MSSSEPLKAKPFKWMTVLFLLFCCTWFANGNSYADETADSNISLRAKYKELDKQLRNNQFQRALYLNSAESSYDLMGEIYAVVDYPFATVNQALNNPDHWCDVLILHVNIKYCRASSSNAATILKVYQGKTYEQQLADAYRIEFNYREKISTPDYFDLELSAKNGPLGTRDYRIRVEATPIENRQTFLHFTYAYSFDLTGSLAMQGYLVTNGRNKVGFTATGKQPNGQPTYIKGVRGLVERNTMRYFLAIDAYLAALTAPADDQLEKRLQKWYDGTDQYYRQLHEVAKNNYFKMKRNEYQRQQVAQ